RPSMTCQPSLEKGIAMTRRTLHRNERSRRGGVPWITRLGGILALCLLASCNAGQAPNFPSEADATPAEDSIGERLFLDTRFAQYFATHMTGVNAPLAVGDPVVQQVYTANGTLPGPFAGQSINCRSCHFVTEFQGVTGA